MRQLFLLPLFVFCTWTSVLSQNETNISSLLEEAEKALSIKDLEVAKECYEIAQNYWSENPDSTSLIFIKNLEILSGIAFFSKNLEEAAAPLEVALPLLRQQSSLSEKLLYDTYFNLATIYHKQRQYTKEAALLKKAISDFEKIEPGSLKLGVFHLNLGKALRRKGDYDEGLAQLQQTEAIFEQLDSIPLSKHINLHSMLGILYNKKSNYEKVLEHYNIGLNLSIKHNGPTHTTTADLLYNLANAYLRLGANTKALEHYQKAKSIFEIPSQLDPSGISDCYSGMGIIYRRREDYTRALDCYQRGLDAKLNQEDNYPPNLATAYANIGRLYDHTKDYANAKIYLEKAEKIASDFFGKEHTRYANILKSMGIVTNHSGNTKEGIKLLKKALDIFYQQKASGSFQTAQATSALADIYRQQKKWEEAINYYQKSIDLYQNIQAQPGIRAEHRAKIGLCRAYQQHFKEGVSEADSSLRQLQFSSQSPASFDNIEDISSLVKVLKTKATIYQLWYKNQSSLEHLKAVQISYETALNVLDFIRNSYREESSKQQLYSNHYDVFSNLIDTYWLLYHQTQDLSYQEKALQLASKSKGLLLQEAVTQAQIEAVANIPSKLLLRKQQLRQDLILEEQIYYKAQQQSAGDSLLQKYRTRIFELKEAWFALQDSISQLYPFDIDLMESQSAVSVKSIQNQLCRANKAIALWMMTDTSLYAFTFLKDAIFWTKTDITPALIDSIQSYQKWLSTPPAISFNPLTTPLNSYLYQKIIQPVVQQLPFNIKDLLIIPDGALGYLPFEMLSFSVDDASKTSIPLMERFNISYGYTLGLCLQQQQMVSARAQKSFIGFVPDYKTAPTTTIALRNQPQQLPGAALEVSKISEILDDATYFTGKEATESNFKNLAPQYNILHLSMHAQLEDQEPLYSAFLFANDKDSLNDGHLHAAELYNMQFKADLAVLSACNTGRGQLQKGEGVMSLSRAFTYSGVPATLMSLWKVPDKATAEIMTAFYEALKAGDRKDVALRKAKQQYLQHTISPEEKHPFYWAGFIAVGDMRVLDLDRGMGKWWWILGLGVVFLGGWFWSSKKTV